MTDNLSIEGRYTIAGSLIGGFSSTHVVRNDTVFPHWIDRSTCFWYERAITYRSESEEKIGKEYRLVDAAQRTSVAAFNHERLKTALSEVVDESVNEYDLPIRDVDIKLDPLTIVFSAFGRQWAFDEENGQCCEVKRIVPRIDEALSPDGKTLVFTKDYNLWLKDVASNEDRQLTFDGSEQFAYSSSATIAGAIRQEIPALWSDDSARLLTYQYDTRMVARTPVVDHVPRDGSVRPHLRQVNIAYRGDQHCEQYQILSIEAASGTIRRANYKFILNNRNFQTGFLNKILWWAEDGRRAYFIEPDRNEQRFEISEFDTATGDTRVLFSETSHTFVNFAMTLDDTLCRHLRETNELIWWSERSGWGHLYLYNLDTGELKNPITSGPWRVRSILAVDERRRELHIQTSGRVEGMDPYIKDICRVNIDTGEFTNIQSDDREIVVHQPRSTPVKHEFWAGRAYAPISGVSPCSEYIVATKSRVDQGSESVLIDREGSALMVLEQTDLGSLPNDWEWPEPFEVRAADDETTLYGILFKPPGFSTKNSYPLINFIASGPWISVVPKASFHSGKAYSDRHYFHAAALAALGFVVMLLDSRGTDLRSKRFQDESYGWIPSSANTDDHAYAIEQLADRYSFIDIDRVGIYCQAYRSGLQNFLERQDLYKVCVQAALLDDRINATAYSDKYEGIEGPDNDKRYPEYLVDGMKGKLLIMNAMISPNATTYPVAGTFRVIDALQKANKDFDMIILPHTSSYLFRRSFDYFVKHLLKIEPPKEFDLGLGAVTMGKA